MRLLAAVWVCVVANAHAAARPPVEGDVLVHIALDGLAAWAEAAAADVCGVHPTAPGAAAGAVWGAVGGAGDVRGAVVDIDAALQKLHGGGVRDGSAGIRPLMPLPDDDDGGDGADTTSSSPLLAHLQGAGRTEAAVHLAACKRALHAALGVWFARRGSYAEAAAAYDYAQVPGCFASVAHHAAGDVREALAAAEGMLQDGDLSAVSSTAHAACAALAVRARVSRSETYDPTRIARDAVTVERYVSTVLEGRGHAGDGGTGEAAGTATAGILRHAAREGAARVGLLCLPCAARGGAGQRCRVDAETFAGILASAVNEVNVLAAELHAWAAGMGIATPDAMHAALRGAGGEASRTDGGVGMAWAARRWHAFEAHCGPAAMEFVAAAVQGALLQDAAVAADGDGEGASPLLRAVVRCLARASGGGAARGMSAHGDLPAPLRVALARIGDPGLARLAGGVVAAPAVEGGGGAAGGVSAFDAYTDLRGEGAVCETEVVAAARRGHVAYLAHLLAVREADGHAGLVLGTRSARAIGALCAAAGRAAPLARLCCPEGDATGACVDPLAAAGGDGTVPGNSVGGEDDDTGAPGEPDADDSDASDGDSGDAPLTTPAARRRSRPPRQAGETRHGYAAPAAGLRWRGCAAATIDAATFLYLAPEDLPRAPVLVKADTRRRRRRRMANTLTARQLVLRFGSLQGRCDSGGMPGRAAAGCELRDYAPQRGRAGAVNATAPQYEGTLTGAGVPALQYPRHVAGALPEVSVDRSALRWGHVNTSSAALASAQPAADHLLHGRRVWAFTPPHTLWALGTQQLLPADPVEFAPGDVLPAAPAGVGCVQEAGDVVYVPPGRVAGFVNVWESVSQHHAYGDDD